MDNKHGIIRYGKKMLHLGLVAATWGNISLKSQDSNIFITPSGMDYEHLVPDDIVKVNREGKIIAGWRKPSSELLLHLEIYRARSDVNAVIHTHSLYAGAYAAARKEILPLIEDMAQVIGGTVEVAEYALPGTAELAQNAVKALGIKGAVLLANHGAVGVGKDLEEAFKACLLLEKTAHIGIAAAVLGEPHVLSARDVQMMRNAYLTSYGQK
ncbi:MAG: class II aldolase/adducin family protein [Peptococcaceae bacterium]